MSSSFEQENQYDIIFVGVYKGKDFDQIKTARTNLCSLSYLKDLFPRKTIIPLELKKDDYNPHKGCLHLDCAFMPVNNNKAILNKEAFKSKRDYHLILDIFGDKNIFHLTNNESFNLQTNLLSISPNVVISDVNFSRLNNYPFAGVSVLTSATATAAPPVQFFVAMSRFARRVSAGGEPYQRRLYFTGAACGSILPAAPCIRRTAQCRWQR